MKSMVSLEDLSMSVHERVHIDEVNGKSYEDLNVSSH